MESKNLFSTIEPLVHPDPLGARKRLVDYQAVSPDIRRGMGWHPDDLAALEARKSELRGSATIGLAAASAELQALRRVREEAEAERDALNEKRAERDPAAFAKEREADERFLKAKEAEDRAFALADAKELATFNSSLRKEEQKELVTHTAREARRTQLIATAALVVVAGISSATTYAMTTRAAASSRSAAPMPGGR